MQTTLAIISKASAMSPMDTNQVFTSYQPPRFRNLPSMLPSTIVLALLWCVRNIWRVFMKKNKGTDYNRQPTVAGPGVQRGLADST